MRLPGTLSPFLDNEARNSRNTAEKPPIIYHVFTGKQRDRPIRTPEQNPSDICPIILVFFLIDLGSIGKALFKIPMSDDSKIGAEKSLVT